jgi:hypothetical protein
MKYETFYKTFTTGQIDGILTLLAIQEFKQKGADQDPQYFDADPKFFDKSNKYIGVTKQMKNSLRHVMNHGELKKFESSRDGRTTEGYLVTPTPECVIDYLQRKDMKVGEPDWLDEYSMPFAEEINQLLLIFKWVLGIQRLNDNTVTTITSDDISSLDLPYTVKQLHFRLKTLLGSSFATLRYMEDDNTIEYKVSSRDAFLNEGYGYVKLNVTQYVVLLNNIVKDHEERRKQVTEKQQ